MTYTTDTLHEALCDVFFATSEMDKLYRALPDKSVHFAKMVESNKALLGTVFNTLSNDIILRLGLASRARDGAESKIPATLEQRILSPEQVVLMRSIGYTDDSCPKRLPILALHLEAIKDWASGQVDIKAGTVMEATLAHIANALHNALPVIREYCEQPALEPDLTVDAWMRKEVKLMNSPEWRVVDNMRGKMQAKQIGIAI